MYWLSQQPLDPVAAWQYVYVFVILLSVTMLVLALQFDLGRERLHLSPSAMMFAAGIGMLMVTPQVGLPTFFCLIAIIMRDLGAPVSATAFASVWVMFCWFLVILSMSPSTSRNKCPG